MTLPVLPLTDPEPFPHVLVTDGWPAEQLDAVAREFPLPTDERWKRYGTDHELKFEGPPDTWGDATAELFTELDGYAPVLAELFDVPKLSMETIGGGYHLIPPGGYLNVHTDFNRSPNTDLYRRLNLLIFLNHGWADEGGWLELWGDDMRTEIPPEFNTMVIFETSDRSWHGHPTPARRWRLSVAAYYFSPEPPPGYTEDHSTVWRS